MYRRNSWTRRKWAKPLWLLTIRYTGVKARIWNSCWTNSGTCDYQWFKVLAKRLKLLKSQWTLLPLNRPGYFSESVGLLAFRVLEVLPLNHWDHWMWINMKTELLRLLKNDDCESAVEDVLNSGRLRPVLKKFECLRLVSYGGGTLGLYIS